MKSIKKRDDKQALRMEVDEIKNEIKEITGLLREEKKADVPKIKIDEEHISTLKKKIKAFGDAMDNPTTLEAAIEKCN
jgi:copper chaperone CopZ